MKAFDARMAAKFARMALEGVHRQYPNKVSHLLNGEQDVLPPREMTPAFYGCYDWHSAVHTHWLLARVARLFPQEPVTAEARAALERSLTPAKIKTETAYFTAPGREAFERPYGIAWLLQLAQELREWQDADARRWATTLAQLVDAAEARVKNWLPKLQFPVRTGEHSQTAFAMALMLDYAMSSGDQEFVALLQSRAREFFLEDREWPIYYEPSGEDFVSPGLAEADLMRRELAGSEYAEWLSGFLPSGVHPAAPKGGAGQRPRGMSGMRPVRSPDPADPKFSHLNGLNLSRAWMQQGIAAGLAQEHDRRAAYLSSAEEHAEAGLAAVTGAHYVGSHWLGTFAVYLLSGRGLR